MCRSMGQYKLLGVILDSKMSWKAHIEYISTNISKGIGILVRARQLLLRDSLLTLFNSLIEPYLTYCLNSWGSTSQSNIKKLFFKENY